MRQEFGKAVKLAAYERAGGACEKCGTPFGGKLPQYDHVNPAAFGGSNSLENCMCLCAGCHGTKTARRDMPAIAKSNRIRARAAGIKPDRTIRAWRGFDNRIIRK